MTLRRYVVRKLGSAIGVPVVWLSVVASHNGVAAQVGHDPAHSPYRDITRGAGPVLFAGHVGGDRGRAGVGPSNGLSFGARYELPAGRSMVFQFSGAYVMGDRFIVDPAADSSSPARRFGAADTDLLLTEVAMQLRLAGSKSWHGVAPYLGVGLGLAFDVNSPGDTTQSGYTFGNKITLSGATGVRLHSGRRFTVQAEAKALLWRLKYPFSFRSQAPDGSRVLPATASLTDWTLHPWVSLGLGWTF